MCVVVVTVRWYVTMRLLIIFQWRDGMLSWKFSLLARYLRLSMQSDCIFQWMCLPFRVLETCLNLQDVHIYCVCVCDKPFSHSQRLCSAKLQYKAHLPQNMTTNMAPQRYMILNLPSIHDNRSHNVSTTHFVGTWRAGRKIAQSNPPGPQLSRQGVTEQLDWEFQLARGGPFIAIRSPGGPGAPTYGCSKLTGTGIPPRFMCA